MRNIKLVDTHCHIHDPEFNKRYEESSEKLIDNANNAGVTKLVCVVTDVLSSKQAVEFCKDKKNCFASLAIHPHEAENQPIKDLEADMSEIAKILDSAGSVVAIGECGLDYFYHDDPQTHKKQEDLFRMHIDLAQKYRLPMIFHIRDPKAQSQNELGHAFADFFRIVDDYKDLTGVVHSFSAGILELNGSIKRGFYIGLNGIMTFTKDKSQLDAARAVPRSKLVLETDAPFLTPAPFRVKVCEPMHVRVTAEFLSKLRGESLEELAKQTTANAHTLFGL